MNHSENIADLAMALSKAQGQMGVVRKTQKVLNKNKTLLYKYASIEDVLDVIKQPLADNGLVITQLMDTLDNLPALTTMMIHTSGQWMKATVPLIPVRGINTNATQDLGIAITFEKRYALTAMCMLSTLDDTDGRVERKPPAKKAQPKVDFNGTEPIAPKGKAPHWIEDAKVRKRFWAKYHGEGLSNDEIHQALDVESVKDFTGTMNEAMAKIEHWIENMALLDEVDDPLPF
jgi:hypothetical protein